MFIWKSGQRSSKYAAHIFGEKMLNAHHPLGKCIVTYFISTKISSCLRIQSLIFKSFIYLFSFNIVNQLHDIWNLTPERSNNEIDNYNSFPCFWKSPLGSQCKVSDWWIWWQRKWELINVAWRSSLLESPCSNFYAENFVTLFCGSYYPRLWSYKHFCYYSNIHGLTSIFYINLLCAFFRFHFLDLLIFPNWNYKRISLWLVSSPESRQLLDLST